MRVAVVGASGFIGRYLVAAIRARGDDVVTASLRDPHSAAQRCAGADAVVNLAGEPVAQRWSTAVKERVKSSRVAAPRALIAAIAESPQKRRRTFQRRPSDTMARAKRKRLLSPTNRAVISSPAFAWDGNVKRAAPRSAECA